MTHQPVDTAEFSAMVSADLRNTLAGNAPRPLLSRSAEERLGLRHRQVLDQLEAMFMERGFSAFTIGDLASGIGCSRRTIYEIADSKDQLVLVVLDRFLHKKGRSALAEIDASAPVAEQLRRYTTGGIKFQFRSLLFEDLADDAPARRLVDRHYRFAMTVVEQLVMVGVERGEFRPVNPAVVAAVIAGSSLYLGQPEIADDTGVDISEMLDEMLDLVLPSLVAPA